MLEFLRIKRNAIKESDLKKYLLFSLGEIFFVMIGILLALQVDTLVKERENEKEEKRILTNLLEQDLKKDNEQLTQLIHKVDSLSQTIMSNITGEKVDFILKLEAIIEDFSFQVNDGTFNEATSSGTMRLIKSDDLRGQIFKYYLEIENHKFLSEQSAYKYNHEFTSLQIYEKVLATSESFARYNIEMPLPELNLEELIRDQKFMGSFLNRITLLRSQIESWENLKRSSEDLSKRILEELN
jgi:hypothetical protein